MELLEIKSNLSISLNYTESCTCIEEHTSVPVSIQTHQTCLLGGERHSIIVEDIVIAAFVVDLYSPWNV